MPSRCGALPDTVIIQPNGPDSWEIVDGDGYVMRNGMMLELPVECAGPIEGPVGTEEDKLTYESYRSPRFVVVDDQTGEVIAGAFWSGTSCTTQNGEPDWTCTRLGDYMHVTFPLDASEGFIVRDIDLQENGGVAQEGSHEIVLKNDLAAPGCTLVDEEVTYRKTGEKVEA